jgi:hypothetical protein
MASEAAEFDLYGGKAGAADCRRHTDSLTTSSSTSTPFHLAVGASFADQAMPALSGHDNTMKPWKHETMINRDDLCNTARPSRKVDCIWCYERQRSF